MALWLPRRFRGYGSAISGREPNLIVGYEMDPHEGELVNKEVSGAGGGSDAIAGDSQGSVIVDPILGRGVVFRGSDVYYFSQTGDTCTAGTVALTCRDHQPLTGTNYLFYAVSGATNYRIFTSGGAGALSTRFGDSATEFSNFIPTAMKAFRILVTWGSGHVYVYIDGELVDDYVAAFAFDMATCYIGANTVPGDNGLEGEIYDPILARRTFTADEAKRDYQQSMATRAQFLEDFSGAFVSSADQGGAAGTPIENTAWKCSDATGRFQIVDAAIPPNQNAKALKGTVSGSECYIENQQLGLKADDPEAAYGTWEWWFYKTEFGSGVGTMFIGDTASKSTATGYDVTINGNESLSFYRRNGGAVVSTLLRTNDGVFPKDQWCKVTITRAYDGEFTLYIDDVMVPASDLTIGTNPVTDNTYRSSSYISMVLDHNPGEMFTHLSKRFGVAP